ncbi:hypothetical protein AYI70_g7217 [Smittium culicis]|uniref:Uncharacterized protein n=1 Tax=Smittium culicis TaxID=133412 RepID=A0A1R1XLJ1_9FUNG|nr:hypothetical protein AYI70_g7217 [Smittium culicis]
MGNSDIEQKIFSVVEADSDKIGNKFERISRNYVISEATAISRLECIGPIKRKIGDLEKQVLGFESMGDKKFRSKGLGLIVSYKKNARKLFQG